MRENTTTLCTVTAVRPGINGLPTWCEWVDESGEIGEISYVDYGKSLPMQVGDQFPISVAPRVERPRQKGPHYPRGYTPA